MSRRLPASANYVFRTKPKDGRRRPLVTCLASARDSYNHQLLRSVDKQVYNVSTKKPIGLLVNSLYELHLIFTGNDASIKGVPALDYLFFGGGAGVAAVVFLGGCCDPLVVRI